MAQEQEPAVEATEAEPRGTCFIHTNNGPIVLECRTPTECDQEARDAGGEVESWVQDPGCE